MRSRRLRLPRCAAAPALRARRCASWRTARPAGSSLCRLGRSSGSPTLESERLTWSAFAFPAWGPSTLRELLEGFDGHQFRSDRRRAPRAGEPGQGLGPGGPRGYAARRLVAIGRDTVVGQARTGRAPIRALPPVRGAARLPAVAVLAQLGEFAALFVQQIVSSVPGETDPGGHPVGEGAVGQPPSRVAQ